MGNNFRKVIFRFVVCLAIVVMILPLTAPQKHVDRSAGTQAVNRS